MKTIEAFLKINKLNKQALIKIKGGTGNSSSAEDEATANQMRPRTGMFGG